MYPEIYEGICLKIPLRITPWIHPVLYLGVFVLLFWGFLLGFVQQSLLGVFQFITGIHPGILPLEIF